ncbi:MAG: AMP-dependent synthetase, partial [Candidatus Sericytochromatia bacterium]
TMRTFHIGGTAQVAEQSFFESGSEGVAKIVGPTVRASDGELVVTGRLKDLIILAGRNHYPQDLEWTVERAAPTLRAGSGAAFTVPAADRPESEALVLTQEWEGPVPDAAELNTVIAAIRRNVASDHALEPTEVVLVAAGGVPKTSSGKVRRSACRAAYLAGELPVVASWREATDV